jgi:hypothetical protein
MRLQIQQTVQVWSLKSCDVIVLQVVIVSQIRLNLKPAHLALLEHYPMRSMRRNVYHVRVDDIVKVAQQTFMVQGRVVLGSTVLEAQLMRRPQMG